MTSNQSTLRCASPPSRAKCESPHSLTGVLHVSGSCPPGPSNAPRSSLTGRRGRVGHRRGGYQCSSNAPGRRSADACRAHGGQASKPLEEPWGPNCGAVRENPRDRGSWWSSYGPWWSLCRYDAIATPSESLKCRRWLGAGNGAPKALHRINPPTAVAVDEWARPSGSWWHGRCFIAKRRSFTHAQCLRRCPSGSYPGPSWPHEDTDSRSEVRFEGSRNRRCPLAGASGSQDGRMSIGALEYFGWSKDRPAHGHDDQRVHGRSRRRRSRDSARKRCRPQFIKGVAS
jgi:hypothetical protein